MKFLIFITIIFTLISVNRAAVAQGIYKDSKHPGKCVIGDIILSPGEYSQEPNDCAQIFCGTNSWVQIHTCYTESAPEGYELSEPIMPQADYPDCCKRTYIPKN